MKQSYTFICLQLIIMTMEYLQIVRCNFVAGIDRSYYFYRDYKDFHLRKLFLIWIANFDIFDQMQHEVSW